MNVVYKTNPETGASQTFATNLGNPLGILFDGASIWFSTTITGVGMELLKLNSDGSIALTVNTTPHSVCSDGVNFWISMNSSGGKVALF